MLIDVQIADMLGVSRDSCKFEQTAFGRFRYCEVYREKSLWGNVPLVYYYPDDNYLAIGRIYTDTGSFGSFSMADVKDGYFGFDITIKVTVS